MLTHILEPEIAEWYNLLTPALEVCMPALFPSEEWLKGLEAKINTDERYARIAKNWEGDLLFFIETDGGLKERLTFYLDLWHGTCRKAEYNPQPDFHPNPAFTLTAPYSNITAILSGQINPITAMMTSTTQ